MADEGAPTTQPAHRPWGWLVAALLLAALWLQHSSASHEPQGAAVDYSTAVGWIREGKVKSVVLRGGSLSGVLVAPQPSPPPHAGQVISEFQVVLPKDDWLIPLLDDHHVAIKVESEETSLAVQLALAVLPWVVIVAVWLWLSRRARQMMLAGGGPIAGFLKRGRKFEKTTTSKVTFDDVAGLAAAKRDLEEIVAVPQGARAVPPARRPRSRAACCCSARPAPARRCSRARSPARPTSRSTRSPHPSSSRCSSASAPRACASCSRRPSSNAPVDRVHRRDRRGRARAGDRASAAATTSASRRSTSCCPRWTASIAQRPHRRARRDQPARRARRRAAPPRTLRSARRRRSAGGRPRARRSSRSTPRTSRSRAMSISISSPR